jgi:hypothetical protein
VRSRLILEDSIQNFLTNQIKTEIMHQDEANKWPCIEKIIIKQNNKYKALFDIWMLILATYSCIMSAYAYLNLLTFNGIEYPLKSLPVILIKLLTKLYR